ncbi:FK506-binding protein 4/5 [Fistulifera solaris]|uniref:peptidylprolyl isomerase n=1 Tax=Fistulifera solaris TaxID=1519565 RepID=A0A1Z5JT58_FISSO|nr:FK506-binding protein 4/5 [Fistulifera solaris]|eukprot:GAX17066.1 FK506-binding protein 4/5 [Fistulifera solaris]
MNNSHIPARLQGPGVLLRTVIKGDNKTFAKIGDRCLVHFEAFLEDGTKIDSSYDRKLPFQFRVGEGQVVAGWDVALTKMSVGTIAEVTIPPLYAYGAVGFPPRIPPDATLMYRIELLKVNGDESS